MCLPYSVLAMGPYSTGFQAARQPACPSYIPHAMTCHACGAQLSSTARFCHKCGAAIAGVHATGWRGGLPWAPAGAALGALVTVLAMRGAGAGSREPGAESTAPRSQLPAPDISQMSPPERANRLFNRVMVLAEAGKNDSVQFFLPMAFVGYAHLPTHTPPQTEEPGSPHTGPAPISRTIHVAHSPDADDAFMFWAMAAGKIDTGGRRYVHELGDIESLNRRALAGELEVTAVSLHAYAYLADRYALLAHGASIPDRY